MNVVPENLVQPIVNRDMLQIIFVSILFGVTLNMLGEKAQLLKESYELYDRLTEPDDIDLIK